MKEFAGLPLKIKPNPRAKRVLVKLVPGRGLEVVMPPGFPSAQILEILQTKSAWIERTRDKMIASGVDLSGRPPELPTTIEFLASDRAYTVSYVNRPGRLTVTENVTRLMVRGAQEEPHNTLAALQKFTAVKAREFFLPRLARMSQELRMPYAALRVRRQRTRWGSCSARGTISINAKLLFLPLELGDHLLLHELCHTQYLDHSNQYWKLVGKHEPDFARLEDELKRGGRYVPSWCS